MKLSMIHLCIPASDGMRPPHRYEPISRSHTTAPAHRHTGTQAQRGADDEKQTLTTADAPPALVGACWCQHHSRPREKAALIRAFK